MGRSRLAEFGLPHGSAAAAAALKVFESVDSYEALALPQPRGSNGRGFYGGAPAAMPRPDMWGVGVLDQGFVYHNASFAFVEAFA